MTTLTLRPNGDTTAGWEPSTGNNEYACIDESVADDADYVYVRAIVDTGISVYAYPDHTTESGDINSVKIYARCKDIVFTGVPPATSHIKLSAYSGINGTDQTLTSSWAVYTQTWTTNPNTGVAWTWADIDALSAGFTGILSAPMDAKNYSRPFCSHFYVEVDHTGASPGWANIKNIRAGTGLITATDVESIWFGTSQIAVADIAEMNGVAV